MNHRLAIVAFGALGGSAAAGTAPFAMRHLSFFDVRQVELVGVEYYTPETVLTLMDLPPELNVFADADRVARRAARLPAVEAVRVERRLPGTLTVSITERAPVALAVDPHGLVPVDDTAEPLPYDPTRSEFDLPIIAERDAVLARVLGRIRLADSLLFGEIDGARSWRGGGVELGVGSHSILLPAAATVQAIRDVALVYRHVEASTEGYRQIDGRYATRVFVRRDPT